MNDPFADIRDKRIGELSDEQKDRATELWLREQIGPSERYWHPLLMQVFRVIDRLRAPIDMVLHCPACGLQHIDAAEPIAVPADTNDMPAWTNPPHRSHKCAGCGHIWRPADVPTNGVQEIKTKGKNDSPEVEFLCDTEAQGFAIEAIHQFCPELRFREDGQTLLTPAQVEAILRRMGWKAPGEPRPAQQPRLTVRLQSFPESNGKRNWTALLVRVDPWGGLIGNCGGITIERGEMWNRVAYEAERAKLLIGERDTEPFVLDYGNDIATPEEWAGEVHGGRPVRSR